MPLLHRARAAAMTRTARRRVSGGIPAGRRGTGPRTRGPVLHPAGSAAALPRRVPQSTPAEAANAEIAEACGLTTVYYPQISVAVATSPDPGFLKLIGPDRAYSAQGESIAKRSVKRKKDDTELFAALEACARPSSGTWISSRRRPRTRSATGSKSVVVGVLDSGVDAEPPRPRRRAGPRTVRGLPDRQGRHVTVRRGSRRPPPHGTHVAGTIAAADDGRGTTGVAPGVRIASVKVVDDDGFIYPEYAVCGFMWAAVART